MKQNLQAPPEWTCQYYQPLYCVYLSNKQYSQNLVTETGFFCPTRSSRSLMLSSRQRTLLGLGTGFSRGLWMVSSTSHGSIMPSVIRSVWPVTMSPHVLGLPPTREMMRSSAPPTTPDWCLWNMERWADNLVFLPVYTAVSNCLSILILASSYMTNIAFHGTLRPESRNSTNSHLWHCNSCTFRQHCSEIPAISRLYRVFKHVQFCEC